MANLKVGDTVWIFDSNRRVYAPGSSGPPIYREHFVSRKIVGETSRSWILEGWSGTKVDKKTLKGIFPTQESIDDQCWIHDHKYRVGRALDMCNDANKLRQIAEILNWKPE